MRILYVEDIPLNAQLLSAMCSTAFGQEADIAETGEVALDMLQRGDYDLVFVDINLPGISGIEVTRQARALSAYKNTPFIAVSADATMKTKEEAMEVGVNAYITKPVSMDALKSIVGECLRQVN